MELQPISQVSKNYGISAQMLRYYEQIGLIKSIRNDENAYRFYDETAVKQLHSIIILRKLRISVKQIKEILNNPNALTTVKIFERNISELDEEITSLSTIKAILTRFAEELRAKADLQLDLLNNANTLSIIDSISFSKNYINNIKENLSMEDLNKASETLEKLEEKKSRETIGPEIPLNPNQQKTEKFEIVKFEPCRFIGASVYLQNKGEWAKTQTSGNEEITKFLWERSGWIFEALEGIKGYVIDGIHKAALTTWEKYDDKNALFGYYIGRFYKANTPVPCDSGGAELDYFDINEEYMAKLWVKGKLNDGKHGQFWNTPQAMNEEIEKSDYVDRCWVCFAQVFKEPDEIGFYWPCALKNNDEKK